MASNSTDYVITLSSTQNLEDVLEDAKDWAQCHGLAFRTPEHKDCSDVCQIAPFALFPSPFPKNLFEQAIEVQEAMSLLYFRISWDYDFLLKAHEAVIKTDKFTKKMIEILMKVHQEGYHQKNILLTQRADYMAHMEENGTVGLKQIEVNNIATSMGGLSQRVSSLHEHVLQKYGVESKKIKKNVPKNRPVDDCLAKGIFEAVQIFLDPVKTILVVVEEVNQNQLDQKFIEFSVEEWAEKATPPIRVQFIRATFTECVKKLSLSPDFNLIFGKTKIHFVYFRAGYVPDHYKTEEEWNARLTMERSTAIKCPWIGLQLANTKKIQQVLNEPGMVERFFIGDSETPKQIRATFAGLWGLEHDDKRTENVVKDALANPQLYVLKPQLEGGAGNYFGDELVEKLTKLSGEERAAYILMQKINPLVVKNYLVRAFQPIILSDVVSELGIFGILIGHGDSPKTPAKNFAHGHILRSKIYGVKEGGVAVGAAVIDSPYLFD